MTHPAPHPPPFADALRSLTLTPSPEPSPLPGRTHRHWPLAAAVLIGCAAGICLLAGQVLQSDAAPPLVTPAAISAVTPAGAAPLPQVSQITGSGYVTAPAQALIFGQSPGQITRVLVQAGDRVAAGQVLITLTDADAGFALEQARVTQRAADLTLAARRIEETRAEADLARSTALLAARALSRQKFEEVQASRDLAANAVLQAEQVLAAADLAIRIAMERLDELTIRAPIPGVITRLNARKGDRVLAQLDDPGAGQSLATITDTQTLVVDADVAETSLAQLQEGLAGEAVLDAWPDHPFAVEIARIAPVITPEKGTVSLRLRLIDPPPGILPAMAARIRISTKPTGSRS